MLLFKNKSVTLEGNKSPTDAKGAGFYIYSILRTVPSGFLIYKEPTLT